MRNSRLPHKQRSENLLRVVSLRDGPHQREPGRSAVLRRRIWVAIENRFKPRDLATAAQAAHERARVRDHKASSAVDRVFQGNAADTLFSGNFEQLRHRGFSLPFLELSF